MHEGLKEGERGNAACTSVQSFRGDLPMDLAARAAARHLTQEGLKEAMDLAAHAAARHLIQEGLKSIWR